MKLTTEQIKQMIKEEISSILKESKGVGYHPIWDLSSIAYGQDGILPFTLNDELVGPDEEVTLNQIWGMMEEKHPGSYKKISKFWGDEEGNMTSPSSYSKFIEFLCEDSDTVNQVLGLMESLVEGFQGYQEGSLAIENYEFSNLKVRYEPQSGGLVVTQSDGDLRKYRLDLSYGRSFDEIFDYDIVGFFEEHELGSGFDEGSGGYGGQDVAGSVDVDVQKLINLINNNDEVFVKIEYGSNSTIAYSLTLEDPLQV